MIKRMFRKFVSLVIFVNFAILVDSGYALNLDKAKASFLSQDYQSVISQGEKILAARSCPRDSADLYYILGLSYLKEGNYLRAAEMFQIILKDYRDSGFADAAKLGLADGYFLRNDFNSAEPYYEELISNNSRSRLKAQSYYRLSQIASQKGEAKKEKEYSDKLNQAYPLNLETRFHRDLCLLPDSASNPYYTVQVGSFSSRENADNLLKSLTRKGYSAYIEEANYASTAKPVYRVRVGKFRQRQEARQTENKLSQDGYPTRLCP